MEHIEIVDPVKSEWGANYKRVLHVASIGQKELAQYIGVSERSVHAILKRKHNPKAATQKRYENALRAMLTERGIEYKDRRQGND